ncbi:MAG: hypothetical protein NW226_08750 [Microscillaceae bacterium]|nr:hypothetical protein [Microscillaceae bacterium]
MEINIEKAYIKHLRSWKGSLEHPKYTHYQLSVDEIKEIISLLMYNRNGGESICENTVTFSEYNKKSTQEAQFVDQDIKAYLNEEIYDELTMVLRRYN